MSGIDRTLSDFDSKINSIRMLLDQQESNGAGDDLQESFDNIENRFNQIESELNKALNGNKEIDLNSIKIMLNEFKQTSVTKSEFEIGMGDKVDKSDIQDIVSMTHTYYSYYDSLFRYIETNMT